MNFTMRAAAALTADLNYVQVVFHELNDSSPPWDEKHTNRKKYIYFLPPGMEPSINDIVIVPVYHADVETLTTIPTGTIKAVTVVDGGRVADLDISKLKQTKMVIQCVDINAYAETEENLKELETELSKRRNRNTQASILAQLGIDTTDGIPQLSFFKPTKTEESDVKDS